MANSHAECMATKVEVLEDLEPDVDRLMAEHIQGRKLWMPSDLFGEQEDDHPESFLARLRGRAAGIVDEARVAIALNIVTEEGLPHFHRLLATHLGEESIWQKWNNLWTAEEDRHGMVLHNYARDARLFDQRKFECLQYDYIEAGFQPAWDRDPYRVFVYTSLQERATQVSHANTGQLAGEKEPKIGYILKQVAADEARHFAFYRRIFSLVLERDPNQALVSAAKILPSIEMPGISMPNFREFADVVRRAGIYGPWEYLKIVDEQIKFWKIEAMTGLSEVGRRAQEKILGIPKRLERIAKYIDAKSDSKTYSFDIIFDREFSME